MWLLVACERHCSATSEHCIRTSDTYNPYLSLQYTYLCSLRDHLCLRIYCIRNKREDRQLQRDARAARPGCGRSARGWERTGFLLDDAFEERTHLRCNQCHRELCDCVPGPGRKSDFCMPRVSAPYAYHAKTLCSTGNALSRAALQLA